eukprot:UN00385
MVEEAMEIEDMMVVEEVVEQPLLSLHQEDEMEVEVVDIVVQEGMILQDITEDLAMDVVIIIMVVVEELEIVIVMDMDMVMEWVVVIKDIKEKIGTMCIICIDNQNFTALVLLTVFMFYFVI